MGYISSITTAIVLLAIIHDHKIILIVDILVELVGLYGALFGLASPFIWKGDKLVPAPIFVPVLVSIFSTVYLALKGWQYILMHHGEHLDVRQETTLKYINQPIDPHIK